MSILDKYSSEEMGDSMRLQYMNAMLKTVGSGAVVLCDSIQNIHKPGERLAAATLFLKCICDSYHLPLHELFASIDRMEKEALRMGIPELAGARAYIENDFLKHD